MPPIVSIKVSYGAKIAEPIYRKQVQSDSFIAPIPSNVKCAYVLDRHYSQNLVARIMYIMRYNNDPCCNDYISQAVSDILNHTSGLSPYDIQHTLELDDLSALELLEVLYQLEKDISTKFLPGVALRDVFYYIDEDIKTLLLIVRRKR